MYTCTSIITFAVMAARIADHIAAHYKFNSAGTLMDVRYEKDAVWSHSIE
jgi:hypothetical protein